MRLRLPRIKRIQVRITIYFSLLIFLIVIAISTSISLIFSGEIIEQTSTVLQQKIGIITRDIDEKLVSIKNLYYNIRNNEEMQSLMNIQPTTPDEGIQRIKSISSILSNYSNGNNSISKIIAIDDNNNVLDPLYSLDPYNDAIIRNGDFEEFVKSSFSSRFSSPLTFPTDEKENMTITFYSQYLRKTDYKQTGYILINIKKENLFSDIKSYSQDIFDTTYIVNRDGKLIYRIGDEEFSGKIASLIPSGNTGQAEMGEIGGKNYLMVAEVLKNTPDWRVVGIISYDRLTEKVEVMSLVIYLIGAVCILLVIVFSFNIAKRITGPILEVNTAMSRFEKGEWPEKLQARSEDELKYLVEGFNRMMSSFKNLVDKIYLEQEKKKKAEVTALQFQLESLQSQINPHFMYNTLNAISYLALKNGANNIREMIQSFNMLLRASMSEGKEFITIKEEVQCILSYLNIQECRYDKIFDFICKVSPDMEHYKIPKLILQPLVENALFHGIAPKNSYGSIKVEFIKQGDRIKVKVIDDGVGIDRSEIPYVIKKQKARNKSSFNNIGLSNVDERLKLYFGDEYRLKIYSSLGTGTCVEFYIPFME